VRRPTAAIVSLILHAVLMTVLTLRQLATKPAPVPPVPVAEAERAQRVYLPSRQELRRMLEPEVPRAPKPPATPTPPGLKDRVSIGPPDTRRAKELELRRDQEIPRTSQGNGMPAVEDKKASAPGRAEATPAATSTPARTADTDSNPDAATGRLRFPDGRGPSAAPTARPSILGSLHRLEDKWERTAGAGLGSGMGLGKTGPKQVGPLSFDPEGADFTEWVNHFTRELYRNWVAPEAALMGFKGRVVVQFVVGRDGTIVEERIVERSGTISLDHAAEDALRASRLLPLPADFGPASVTMTVIFYYNEGPHPS
jgi:TonB family protein